MILAQQRAEHWNIALFQCFTHLPNNRADLVEQRLVARRLGLPASTQRSNRQARSAANPGIANQQGERRGDGD